MNRDEGQGLPPTERTSDSHFLRVLTSVAEEAHPTLLRLVQTAGTSGFGFLVVLLSLIAIPFVGVSTPFGLLVAGLGVQLTLALPHPWLPRWLARRQLPPQAIGRVRELVERRFAWLDRRMHPRAFALTRGLGRRIAGLMIALMGIGLALPLPIPGSNWIFIAPLVVLGLGLLEEDGWWVAAGHLLGLANLIALWFLQDAVRAALTRIAAWLGW